MITIPDALAPVAVEWATQFLTARGAVVSWPGDGQRWETMAEVVARVRGALPEPRPTEACLRSRLGSASCPDFPRKNHPSGRLHRMVATPELIRFLAQPPQPGEAL